MAEGVDPSIQSGENLDDLFKCNICLGTLKEPKLLPCLHTFCKSCIRTYIESSKQKKDNITCPICRQPILSPSTHSADDIESIINSLSENNFVRTMLNNSAMSKLKKVCDSCTMNGTKSKAISWCVSCSEAYCEKCEICHKTFKISADHDLIPITDIGKNNHVNISKVVFCDDHLKREVEVYCVDHKKACCALCGSLSHRKCDKLIPIEEAASGIKQKPEVSKLLENMGEYLKLLADVITRREDNETKIETEANEIETVVKSAIVEMKKHLEKMQRQMLGDLEAAKKQTSMKITDDINDFTSFKSAITNWRCMLSGVVEHGSEEQCLIFLNEITSKFTRLQDQIRHTLKNIQKDSFRFEVAKCVKDFEKTMKSLGDFQISKSKFRYKTGNLKHFTTDFRNGDIKVLKTIKVASSGQSSGIFLDGLMVFTLCSDMKVAKYSQDGEELGKLSVPNYPHDICHTTAHRVAVTNNHSSELYIVDCQDLTLLKTIKLPGIPVHGVCVFDKNQFLISWGEHLTWIEQSSGTKVKTVTTSGQSSYVTTSGDNDYIHGDGFNSASYVVNDKKKFTYTNNQLSMPRGIGIDDEDNFYICGRDSKNIHQITIEGELVRIIPNTAFGGLAPWVVRFEKKSKRFLVTCSNSGKATLCAID